MVEITAPQRRIEEQVVADEPRAAVDRNTADCAEEMGKALDLVLISFLYAISVLYTRKIISSL